MQIILQWFYSNDILLSLHKLVNLISNAHALMIIIFIKALFIVFPTRVCFPLIQFYFCINVFISLVEGYGLIPLPPIKLKYVFLYYFTIPENSSCRFLDPDFFSIVNFLFCDESTSIANYLESIRNFCFRAQIRP